MREIDRRRSFSQQRIEALRSSLTDATAIISDKACVYLTGSLGRKEAGEASDLDLFIVGASGGEQSERLLSRLDEICLKAELIRAERKLRFPEFSGDGEFLQFHTIDELVGGLGTSTDDSQNTFTARLLLLLESRCLLGDVVYQAAIESVLAKYWRDFADHAENFAPAFLANDILRLWRTLCVNYEARTETEPPEKKARRSLKNYKLKHSRLLTCYSGILFLLANYSSYRTVRLEDAIKMVGLSPTERLEWLGGLRSAWEPVVGRVLDAYENFLNATRAPEAELIELFQSGDKRREFLKTSEDLGGNVLAALNEIGHDSRFHRLLVV